MSEDDARRPPRPNERRTRPSVEAAFDSSAPRLTLPRDDVDDGATGAGQAEDAATPPLDAWNQDKARRSSFPPDGGLAAWAARRVTQRTAPVTPENEQGEEGEALALVHRSSSANPAIDLRAEMEERFSLHDFTGALRVAEFLLGRDAGDGMAAHYAQASRRKLEQLLLARLTREGAVPQVAMCEDEIRWLGLDHRAAWLLSRVDGMSGCDELLDGVGMERLEGLRLLTQLLDAGAIRMGG